MRKKYNPVLAIIIASLVLFSSGILVWAFPPTPFLEILFLGFLILAVFLFILTILKSLKNAVLLCVFLTVLLLLNRFQSINIITVGLLGVIIGLITLNN